MNGGDCRALKKRLTALCADTGRADVLIRIACQELEAWYFGDPPALAQAFGRDQLDGLEKRARYREPGCDS